jgi:hypothetical protein
MHWTYDELLALPSPVYDVLIEWVIEQGQAREREAKRSRKK